MPSRITEILADSRSGKRSIIPQRRSICSSRCHDNRIVKGPIAFKSLDNIGDSRSLLTYGHIYTVDRLACLICTSLIDDGIQSDSRLSCLAVTNNELTLTTADRDHRIYGFKTCLKRLCNRLAKDHTGGLPLKRHLHKFTCQTALAIERVTKRIDHTSDHRLADIYRCDTSSSLYGHTLLYPVGRSEQHRTHIILLQIHHNGHDTVIELQKFTCLRIQQTIDTHHSITHLQDLADLLIMKSGTDLFKLTEQYIRYFRRFNCIRHITLFYYFSPPADDGYAPDGLLHWHPDVHHQVRR